MKKILLAMLFIAVLPVAANAEEAVKAAPEVVHTMQNANPSVAPAVEQAKEQAPEHVMQNANPAPKQPKIEKKHTVRNN